MTGAQSLNRSGAKMRTCGYQGWRRVPSSDQAPGVEIIQTSAPHAAPILVVALGEPGGAGGCCAWLGAVRVKKRANVTAPAFTALRDALDRWQRGEGPRISAQDCARVVRLIDQAYERAG